MENKIATARSIHTLADQVAKAAWEAPRLVSEEDPKLLETSGYREILKRWQDATVLGAGILGGSAAALIASRIIPNQFLTMTSFAFGFEVSRQMFRSLFRS